MKAFSFAVLFLFGYCLPAQAALPLEQFLYEGKAIPFYTDSPNSEQQLFINLAKRDQLAERMASILNGALRMKTNIGVGFESCGNVNAFFSPQRRSIVICSEFIEMVAKTAYNDKDFMMKLPKKQFSKVINGLIWGVYFHELAHAVIHTNRVPITGREEDVADQFAVWFAVNYVDLNQNPIIMPTIWLWTRLAKERDIPMMSEDQRKRFMSNEHSLDEQRIYNMACWVLGTGSEGGAKTARFAGLPEERAQRCPGEYAQVDMGMKNHFKKYLKIKPLRGRW